MGASVLMRGRGSTIVLCHAWKGLGHPPARAGKHEIESMTKEEFDPCPPLGRGSTPEIRKEEKKMAVLPCPPRGW